MKRCARFRGSAERQDARPEIKLNLNSAGCRKQLEFIVRKIQFRQTLSFHSIHFIQFAGTGER